MTADEVEEALLADPTYQNLERTNEEAALKYATEAFKLAEPEPGFVEQLRESTGTAPRHVEEFMRQVKEEPARTFVRPIAETTGFVLGLPYGPGGAVLGTGGGSSVADLAEQATGEQPRPQTLDEAGANTLRNLESGFVATTIDKAAKFGGIVTSAVGNKIKAPLAAYLERHPELQRIRGLAEKFGIPLTPGEATNLTLLKSFIEGIAERAPFSKTIMQNEQMKQLGALVKKRQELLERGGTPESISETGILIQNRTKHLMDEIGVTNEETRRELTESVLARLGSREPFEALGLEGQEAFRAYRVDEAERIGGLHETAMDRAAAGTRVLPTNLQREVRAMEQRSQNTDPKLMGVETDWMNQFRGSGNRAYDAQQQELREGLASVPERARAQARELLLEGRPLEQPGWSTTEIIDLRKRLNSAIDQVDEGLRLTGRVGERGVGASKSNVTKGRLLRLKQALDNDIREYSRTQSPEFQGALEVARAASGDLKNLTNLKGIRRFMQAEPQVAARMLAQSKDLTAIRQLRTILGPAFRHVDRAFSNSILGVGKEGTLTGASIRRELNRYEPGVVEAMVGNGEARQLARLADQLDAADATAITNPLFTRILKSEHPERLVDLIVKPDNVVNIQEVRKTLGQGAVDDIQRGVVNKILQKPAIDVPQEEFMLAPEKLLASLRNYGQKTLDELFSNKPEFLKELTEFAEVAKAAQGATRLSMRKKAAGEGVPLIAFGEMTLTIANPVMGAQIFLGIPTVTKLYLSKTGRRWLTDGLTTKAATPEGKRLFAKIMGLAAAGATIPPPVVPQEQRHAPIPTAASRPSLSGAPQGIAMQR